MGKWGAICFRHNFICSSNAANLCAIITIRKQEKIQLFFKIISLTSQLKSQILKHAKCFFFKLRNDAFKTVLCNLSCLRCILCFVDTVHSKAADSIFWNRVRVVRYWFLFVVFFFNPIFNFMLSRFWN